jgi:histidinol-phosphate aminotransferase
MRRFWRSALEGIVPYQAGKPLEALAAEAGVPELVRLSANENPLGPSPHVVEAIAREARAVHLYPDSGASALRAAIAKRFRVEPDQVIVGNGADELLALLAWAALDPGDEVIVPHPSFEPYTTVVAIAGARAVLSPLAGYDTDLEDIRRRVTGRTKLIVLCSPHNPAATIIRRDPLVDLLAALGPEAPLILLDEAYADFCDDPDYPDGIGLLAGHPTLIVMRTFSKIAGLAGARVGYAVAHADLIDPLNRVRAPYNVNRLAQAGAVAALEDTAYWERSRRVVLEERAFLAHELGRLGYTFPPSQANFLLVRVGAGADAARRRLLEAGILVRDGAAVGFPGHLRISVGMRPTNERLLAALGPREETTSPRP